MARAILNELGKTGQAPDNNSSNSNSSILSHTTTSILLPPTTSTIIIVLVVIYDHTCKSIIIAVDITIDGTEPSASLK